MSTLNKKIDFVMFFTVNKSNPNGDPLSGNMPRIDYDGYGEVSDVCIKRKIRNRMQDMDKNIFVQSNERIEDEHTSLQSRFEAEFDSKIKDEIVEKESCKKWLDVRSFGQVMTFQKRSLGIRGPVSISLGRSLDPIDVITMQITRSTNGVTPKGSATRGSDTMGTKHFVDFGVYKVCGSINCHFAEKTGFTEEDANVIKEALKSLFENDMSSARPEGSMEVKKIYWFTHPNSMGVASTAKIHSLVESKKNEELPKISAFEDYIIEVNQQRLASYVAKGLELEEIDGV